MQFMVYWPTEAQWESVGRETLAYPTWTKDGRSVCGLSMDALHRVQCHSFDTGQAETVAEITEPLLAWPVYPWMGLDPDDNPLVMVDRSTRDLYALEWDAP